MKNNLKLKYQKSKSQIKFIKIFKSLHFELLFSILIFKFYIN